MSDALRILFVRGHPKFTWETTQPVLDNAVMVGWASIPRFLARDHDPFDIDLKPTWSLEDLSSEDITPAGTPSV